MAQEVVASSKEHVSGEVKRAVPRLSRLEDWSHRIRSVYETRRLMRESTTFLREVTPEQKRDLKQFFTGYFEGERWLMQHLHFVMPPMLVIDTPDRGVIQASSDKQHIVCNPRHLLQELRGNITTPEVNFLQASTDEDIQFNYAYPSASHLGSKQFGQASGVEEVLHIAQMRGLNTREGKPLAEVDLSFRPRAFVQFLRQPHEREAVLYKWMFFRDEVKKRKLTHNPFDKIFHLLNFSEAELAHVA